MRIGKGVFHLSGLIPIPTSAEDSRTQSPQSTLDESKPTTMKTNPTNYIIIAILTMLSAARGADIVWTNTSGGSWTNASNWNPQQLPGPTDTAWLTNNGTYTVTLQSNFVSITSLML